MAVQKCFGAAQVQIHVVIAADNTFNERDGVVNIWRGNGLHDRCMGGASEEASESCDAQEFIGDHGRKFGLRKWN